MTSCLQGFQCDLQRPQMTSDLYKILYRVLMLNIEYSPAKYEKNTHFCPCMPKMSLSLSSILRYWVHRQFSSILLFDLWYPKLPFDLHQNLMEFWYLTFGPQLRMRLIEVYLLDILSLQSFPCFDFWKSTRKVTFNLHQKQQESSNQHGVSTWQVPVWDPSLLPFFWDIIHTSNFHGIYSLTTGD